MYMLTVYNEKNEIVDSWAECTRVQIMARLRDNERLFKLSRINGINVGNIIQFKYENNFYAEVKSV